MMTLMMGKRVTDSTLPMKKLVLEDTTKRRHDGEALKRVSGWAYHCVSIVLGRGCVYIYPSNDSHTE